MRRLVILILAVILSINLFADLYIDKDDIFDSSLFSMSISISVLSDDDYIAAKDRYDHFDYLVAQGEPVKAKDVFSEEMMIQFALNSEDIIDLDKVKVGILVSNLDRPVVLIPSELRYNGLSERLER